MGILTDLFVASDGEIDDALVEEGPAQRFPTIEGKSVDTVKITSLNGIATNRNYDLARGGLEQLLSEVTEVRDAGEEGPWVFRLPGALVSALATADEERLAEINNAWAATDEWKLDGVVTPDDIRWLVDDLAALARKARAAGKNVYLWLSL